MSKVVSYTAGMSNGFFVIGDNGVVAVDTGCIDGEAVFQENCANAGIKPEDVRLIVITHGHVDHFFNLNAMKELSKAPALCHESAAHLIEEGLLPDVDLEGRTPLGISILKHQAENGSPVESCPSAKIDIKINEEYDLASCGVAGKLVLTPGHSRGCLSVVLESGEAIVGDLFAAPAGSNDGVTSYFKYIGARFEEVDESLEKLLNMGVHTFYSGHGGPYTRELVEQCVFDDRSNN